MEKHSKINIRMCKSGRDRSMRKKIKILISSFSPELTTRLMYLYNFKKPLNLKNPQGINEKLQYLKLKTYYNNPIITQCVDKYRVRDYIEEHGHSELLPRLIGGAYSSAKELLEHWNEYPERFVIKCNHGCGYNILVTDKENINVKDAIKTVDGWLKEDFWKIYCEPQYRFVKKRIIVEEYLADDIKTYKFYCFNGIPEVCYVSSNGENGEKDLYLDYFDMDWKWLPITLEGHIHSEEKVSKPQNFKEMIDIATELSKDFPFVRVDLYNVDGKVFFSELTFIPTGGNMKLTPETVLEDWGEKLNLR